MTFSPAFSGIPTSILLTIGNGGGYDNGKLKASITNNTVSTNGFGILLTGFANSNTALVNYIAFY